jgi:hypothetical protein
VTAPSPTVNYGNSIPALAPSYSGFATGLAGLSTQPTCTTTATSASPPGQYPVTCSGAVDPDYAIDYVNGVLTIGFTQPCIVHVHGALVVATGQAICISAGGVVFGPIAVKPGGALWVSAGVVIGSITSDASAAIGVCSSVLVGRLAIVSSAGPVELGGTQCRGDLVVGPVSIRNGRGGVSFSGNTVVGPLTITGNTGGFSFSDNIVLGRELVSGNS